MNDLNRIFLTGRLTADPVFKTVGQSNVSEFSLAVNRKFKGDADTVKQSTEFIAIEAWGNQATAVRDYLTKGRQVLLEGELHINQWEDASGKHSRPVVKASNIQFLGNGKPEAQAQTAARSELGGRDRRPGK